MPPASTVSMPPADEVFLIETTRPASGSNWTVPVELLDVRGVGDFGASLIEIHYLSPLGLQAIRGLAV
jgi:hypothetical protein